MTRTSVIVLGCALAILSRNATAKAGPILNPDNGHYYELVTTSTPLNWFAAEAAAESLTFASGQGYLATVTSGNENSFIATHFDFVSIPGNGVYIGGYQPHGSPEPDGGWKWVTGEPDPVAPNYTNWGLNEPNNSGGNEDVMEYPQNTTYKWNDINHDNLRQAYLLEFTPGASLTPEPASVVLLLVGTFGIYLGGKARRRKATD